MPPLGSPRISRKSTTSSGYQLAWAQGAAVGFFAGAVLLTVISRDTSTSSAAPQQPRNAVEFLNHRREADPAAVQQDTASHLSAAGGLQSPLTRTDQHSETVKPETGQAHDQPKKASCSSVIPTCDLKQFPYVLPSCLHEISTPVTTFIDCPVALHPKQHSKEACGPSRLTLHELSNNTLFPSIMTQCHARVDTLKTYHHLKCQCAS